MKQKYVLSKDDENKCLVIQEFAELDKDMLTFVCDSAYEDKLIRSSASKGTDAVVAAIRTPNFYPSDECVKIIAGAVIAFYQRKTTEPVEIIFDDVELMPEKSTRVKAVEAEEPEDDDDDLNENDDLDEMIEDDYDDFDGKPAIKKVNSSIKVVDDEYDDFSDEN